MCTETGGNISSACLLPQLDGFVLSGGQINWLAIGDSITSGVGGTGGGYPGRVATSLVSPYIANSGAWSMVGENTVGAASVYGWNNGYPGEQIQAFYPASWDPSGTGAHDVGPYLAPSDPVLKPQIATVLLGRNNITSSAAATAAVALLGTLLEYMLFKSPTVRIGVCQVIPHCATDVNNWTNTFNAGLPAMIAGLSSPALVRLLQINTGVPWVRSTGVGGWFFDDGHPNDTGYDGMAAFLHAPPAWVKVPGMLYDQLPLLGGYDLAA